MICVSTNANKINPNVHRLSSTHFYTSPPRLNLLSLPRGLSFFDVRRALLTLAKVHLIFSFMFRAS